MSRWLALLKGVNVSGNHLLPMKPLAAMLEENSFLQVQTYLQSGNIIFTHPADNPALLCSQMGELIEQHAGFKPSIILKNSHQLTDALAQLPWTELTLAKDAKTLHFYFLEKIPTTINQTRLATLLQSDERWAIYKDILYFHTPSGFGRSKLPTQFDKILGVTTTARNWNSVDALHKMMTV